MNDLMVVGTLEEMGGARGAGDMWSWYLINNDKKVIKNKDGNEMKWNEIKREESRNFERQKLKFCLSFFFSIRTTNAYGIYRQPVYILWEEMKKMLNIKGEKKKNNLRRTKMLSK